MKQINALTPAQIARMPEWVDRWLKIGLSTEPADFDAAEQAMRNMYVSSGNAQPKIVLRMSSPYGAIIGGLMAEAILKNFCEVRSQVWSQVWSQVESQVESQVGSQVESQVRSQVWSQVESQVWSQVWSQVESQVESQVWSQARSQVGSQVESQVWSQARSQVGSQVESQVWSQARSQVGSQVESQVESQVGSQVRSQVWSQVWSQVGSRWGDSRYQNLNAGWHAYVTFFRDVCGWENDTLAAYANDEILSQHASWTWWAPDVGAISDKPETLHRDSEGRLHSTTEAAMRYRDGWSIYAVHGVRVPADIIEDRSSITVARIEGETNAEIRRVMIDLYGAARYIKDSGAKVVHELPADHKIVGLRTARLLVKEVPGDETIVMVDLLNSTPEPDGTIKRYTLRIDPSAYSGKASTDCWAAAASTWRLPSGELAFKNFKDYAPVFES